VLCYFPRISAGAGTLTPLAPITLQEMKLDPSMAAYQQGKLRVNEVCGFEFFYTTDIRGVVT